MAHDSILAHADILVSVYGGASVFCNCGLYFCFLSPRVDQCWYIGAYLGGGVVAYQDFNQADRVRSVGALSDQTFDLLVIGGGITGAGVARDAALRSLSVALIEAQDLASGTSSRSSKMIHGGLRYLVARDEAQCDGGCCVPRRTL